MSSDTSTYLVAGDIGGTNSRLGLYHHPNVAAGEDSIPNQLCYKEYLNEKYLLEDEDEAPESLFERTILHNFLRDYWSEQSLSQGDDAIESVSIVVCLAIAGPVQNNAVQTSRLKALEINGNHLVERCQTSQDPLLKYIKECYILNDFVAQGYGCLTLTPDELVELIPGSHEKKDPCGPIVCIGAGTGLGTCFLTASKSFSRGSSNNNNHPSFYSCLPSEFGQVEWTPRSDDDVKVWRYLQMKLHSPDRVSLEEVVSGTGLASCYECFAMKYFDKVQPSIEEQFETAGDMKGKVVADNVDACEVCHRAMTTVMRYVLRTTFVAVVVVEHECTLRLFKAADLLVIFSDPLSLSNHHLSPHSVPMVPRRVRAP